MERQIESMMQAQATIRSLYRVGEIDAALMIYDSDVRPYVGAVDPRVRQFARNLSTSLIYMVDDDLASTPTQKASE